MAGRRHIRSILAVLVVLGGAMIFAGQGVAMAACTEPVGLVDVQVDGDACGSLVAVSVTGAAETQCTPLPGNNGCVAASGTGDASNTSSNFACGTFVGASAGCIAVSGTGNASNTAGRSCGYAGAGVFAGCMAISGTGNASNSVAGTCGSETTTVAGVGCISVSGTGNASNTVGPGTACGDASVAAIGIGCIAISGTGDASNTVTSSETTAGRCGTSSLAVGVGCIAVSGQGSASNQAENCGTGDAAVGCREIEGPSGGALGFAARTLNGFGSFSAAFRIASGFWSIF